MANDRETADCIRLSMVAAAAAAADWLASSSFYLFFILFYFYFFAFSVGYIIDPIELLPASLFGSAPELLPNCALYIYICVCVQLYATAPTCQLG